MFDPYIKYCLEESKCVEYLKQLKESNDNFNEYLTWCENQSQCHRLKLADLLVNPMQRVTKYALLLKAVLTRTIDNDEIISLETMVGVRNNEFSFLGRRNASIFHQNRVSPKSFFSFFSLLKIWIELKCVKIFIEITSLMDFEKMLMHLLWPLEFFLMNNMVICLEKVFLNINLTRFISDFTSRTIRIEDQHNTTITS